MRSSGRTRCPTTWPARLRELAVDVVPALGTSELVGWNVAMRPIPGDGFPSVGAVEGFSGYYEAIPIAASHSASLWGACSHRKWSRARSTILLMPFRPARF